MRKKLSPKPRRVRSRDRLRHPGKGEVLTLPPMPRIEKKTIRGIAKDLVGHHSSEVAMRIREGMLSENLRLSLKWLTFVSDRVEGRPVETHRMVGLQEGPSGSYDLTKLPPDEQEKLLLLLRKAKDTTEAVGSIEEAHDEE